MTFCALKKLAVTSATASLSGERDHFLWLLMLAAGKREWW